MTWFRVALWILLSAMVMVVLGGYVVRWYRMQVSSTMDAMLGDYVPLSQGTEKDPPPPVVEVAAARSVSDHERELLALSTGYLDDEDD